MPLSIQDRLAIQDVICLHGHLVDRGELDRLLEVFTANVVYDLTPMGGQILVGVRDIADAAIALGDANPVGHHVTNILVTSEGTAVTATSKAIGIRRDGSVGSLVYDDVLEQTDRGWRISHRRVTLRRNPLNP